VRDGLAVFQSIVEANPLEQIGESFRRGHLEVFVNDDRRRVVQLRETHGELEPTASDHLSEGLEARGHGTSLPSGDDRLRLTDPFSQLGLRQACSKPCFPDQVSTSHGFSIVHICYIHTSCSAELRGPRRPTEPNMVARVGVVPELDLRKIRVFCEERTPSEFRDQMRVEVGVRGKSVTIFECRPPWPDRDAEWTRMPIGQLRFDPDAALWTLFWADRNDRWHLYDLIRPARIERLLREIEDDPTCIFWG
jgi:hypothetical protein